MSPVLLCSEKSISLNHDEGIRRFHGENKVVEIVLAEAMQHSKAQHIEQLEVDEFIGDRLHSCTLVTKLTANS